MIELLISISNLCRSSALLCILSSELKRCLRRNSSIWILIFILVWKKSYRAFLQISHFNSRSYFFTFHFCWQAEEAKETLHFSSDISWLKKQSFFLDSLFRPYCSVVTLFADVPALELELELGLGIGNPAIFWLE